MLTEKYSTYSFLLDRTARRVKQYAQYRFNSQNFGVTVDQWTVLKNLRTHSDLSQKELAEYCGKDQPTLTRIIDLLVSKKLVERRSHPNDRRCFVIHLTVAGEELIRSLSSRVSEIRMEAWKNLDEKDFEDLKRILNTIYQNLEIEEALELGPRK